MIKAGVFNKLTLILFIVGFSSVAQAQVPSNLQVNQDETALIPITPGNCATDNHDGCINMNGRGRPHINFNLTGNRSCSAGGTWALSQVKLGMNRKTVGNLTGDAPSDFNADQQSGVVTPLRQTENQIRMQNHNDSTYSVWYTVYATCDGSVIETDPRIENDGSGRQ